MPRPLRESFAEQFLDWESVMRGGLPVFETTVFPEPPFCPFPGYQLPKPKAAVVDHGHRPSLLGKIIGSPPPIATATDDEPEPERLRISEDGRDPSAPTEIVVALPPSSNPSLGAHAALLRELDGFEFPVGFEIIAGEDVIETQFTVSPEEAPALARSLAAHFPDAVLEHREGRLAEFWEAGKATAILDCALSGIAFASLAVGQSIDPMVGLVGAMADLPPGASLCYQIIFERAVHPWAASAEAALKFSDGELVFPDEAALSRCAEEKMGQRLYGVVARLAASASDEETAWALLQRLGAACGTFASNSGNCLRPADVEDYPEREADLCERRSRRFGMLLAEDELVALAHLPSSAVRTPALLRHVARTHSAPDSLCGDGTLADGLYLGTNLHRGEQRHVHLDNATRARHVHILGTPGSGKSNLILNMVCDDIARGEGVSVVDPHGDLIEGILARLPAERADDVVLLDPSRTDSFVGLNILEAHSDAERTMLASDLVALFSRLSSSWGDQMNVVLRNATSAFLFSDRGGTLADLRRFLVDKAYREDFVPTIRNLRVRDYWESYFASASKGSINAIVTRLSQLLDSDTIGYVLGQHRSTINFDDILNKGRIFLCKLPTGLVGKEDAYLFGSLVVAKIQQTAMARAAQEKEERRPHWFYVDEFQEFATPSMAEIIAETRKYGLGLVLGHQRLEQLDRSDLVSAMELIRTLIVFCPSDRDAKKLSDRFLHFEAEDFLTLDKGEALVRAERADHDFNLYVPLHPEPEKAEAQRHAANIRAGSDARYSRPRQELDAELFGDTKAAAEDSEKRENTSSAPEPSSKAPPAEDDGKRQTAESSDLQQKAAAGGKTGEAESAEGSPGQGRGGPEHRGVVNWFGKFAEEVGLLSTKEKALPGGGYVDIEIDSPLGLVAIEVCVTTSRQHEIENIRKCAAVGYRRIATVCRNKKIAKRMSAALSDLPDGIQWQALTYPPQADEVEAYLLGKTPPGPESPNPKPATDEPMPASEPVVGARRVKSRFAERSAGSQQLVERSLEIITRLMATPPDEQP